MSETKPCKGCKGAKPIYSDGEDFWRFDPELDLYRMVNFHGGFYPTTTHPATTEQQLVVHFGDALSVATELDIMWRTLNLVVDALTAAQLL